MTTMDGYSLCPGEHKSPLTLKSLLIVQLLQKLSSTGISEMMPFYTTLKSLVWKTFFYNSCSVMMSLVSITTLKSLNCVCSPLIFLKMFLLLMVKPYDAPLCMTRQLHWMGDATCLVPSVSRRDALAIHTPFVHIQCSMWYPVASLID